MRTIDRFAVGRWLRALVALLILAWATPSLAAGYWRYAGSATTPPQSQLDQAKAGPGRTFEQKVNGAFQAAGSGAGTLNLSFKTDDVDRRVFLTTVTFSFTADADMRSLTPGQKLRFHGVLTTGGNALAKALPSRGSGKMAAGNGDYFLSTESLIDQPASGDGVFEVPRGSGQGDRLTIYAAGYIGSAGGLGGRLELYYDWVADGSAPPPEPTRSGGDGRPDRGAARAGDSLGSVWDVEEVNGQWRGTWTRRPGTDIFDAVWRNTATGGEVRDVIRIARVSGGQVTLSRDGVGGTYTGTLSADGRSIAGTASWYQPGWTWSARIGGGSSGYGGQASGDGRHDESGGDVDRSGGYGDTSGRDASGRGSSGYSDRGDAGEDRGGGSPSSGGHDRGASAQHAERTLMDNWNTAACGFTDTATLDVSSPIHLSRVDLWFNWRAGERSVTYTVSANGQDFGGGTLTRGDCDPYQGAWCVARDAPDIDLEPGRYEIRAARAGLCQNGGSGGAGFIKAYGYDADDR